MTKRTRLFLASAAAILVFGLGTGLLASYMGFQNFALIGSDGPAELEYVPADAHLVAYANVRDVMNSGLRQKITQLQPGQPDAQEKFLAETGINLERDVQHVVAALSGGTGDGNEGRPLLLARGAFDPVRIEGLVREHGGSATDYRGIRFLSHGDGELGIAFVEPDLVAIGTRAAVRRAIDTKASGADVRANAELMRLVRDISNDGNAWAVARFDRLTGPRLPQELANQLPPINWFAASGHIDSGVSGVIRAETRDDASAQNLREVLQGFVALGRLHAGGRPEMNELVNSLQLGGQGTTVSLGFSVPAEMIDALGAMHAERLEQREREPQLDAPARPARPRRPAQPSQPTI